MADSFTTHYNLTKPEIGGDQGTWGGLLNADLDAIDTAIFNAAEDADAAQTTADGATTTANAALPKAGGTMTGDLRVKTASTAPTAVTPVGGTATLDLSAADAFTLDLSSAGATTLAFSNAPGGSVVVGVVLRVQNGGTKLSYPASVKWDGGTAPSLKTSGFDTLVFVTFDGGTSYEARRFCSRS